MSEAEEIPEAVVGDDEPEETPGYKAPAQKSLKEIEELDQDDESLRKYKEVLLAESKAAADADVGGSNVIVQKLSLIVEGRQGIELDLSGDISKLKENPFVIKEGTEYRLRITFRVQREIVAGLKYCQNVYRKGIKVDKASHMVGSYGPKAAPHEYLTPMDEAPKGMIARGTYVVKSTFVDDDKNVILGWDWQMNIKKDWE